MYYMINSKEDIEQFLKETNWLHDGYIIHVSYSHNGITKLEHGHYFEPEKTKLTIQILVTSIWDAVVEIEFDCLKEWQIRDHQWDIGETSVFIDEKQRVVWSDQTGTNEETIKKGSYAIAETMKWRIVKSETINCST